MDLTKFTVLLCLYTGIRIGEACALRWEHIRLDSGILEVRETMQRIQTPQNMASKTRIIITEPKSASSNRDIPLPQFLMQYIIVFSNNSKQVHEEWNQPPISTWWDSAGTDEDAVHEVKEQLGKLKFDYPKPSTLIERCIEICQNKSARVLDVFAGSGTTAVAVENANLKDNGRRSYTLIQRNELYQGINIADICYKRVQRTIIGSRIAQRCIVYTRSNDGTSDLLSR